jgi:hypothetical protein
MMPPTPFRFRASRTIQHRQLCRRGRQKIDIVPACEGDRYSRVGDPNLELLHWKLLGTRIHFVERKAVIGASSVSGYASCGR